ncbi:hypothetical protein DL98DRAFT_200996 [Cadophora sp. DSE1049]|nr:hypothetical protein DL98DRAFT_200996 [Cadophora sp. DSE1049]
MPEACRPIVHEAGENRYTRYFQHDCDVPVEVFCHDRTLPEEIQDRKYAFARLLGVIGNDPTPMPALEHGAQIGPWYQEFERQNLEARANRINLLDLDVRQRAGYHGNQSERVCDAISNTSPPFAEPDEVSSQVDPGEGPSSGPVGTLRRCDRVDLNAWKEANGYSSDEETPQSEALRSEIHSSTSSSTIRAGCKTESNLTSSGSRSQTADSDSLSQHLSIESKLYELHELEEKCKNELREEIAGIGSGVIVQDEFQATRSPGMSERSSKRHSQETPRDTVFPEASEDPQIVESAINNEVFDRGTDSRETFDHQDNPDHANSHYCPEGSNDQPCEPIAALRRPGFLGTPEEEMLVRRDLQRLNKRVIQGRGAFQREKTFALPKQGMSIDIAS